MAYQISDNVLVDPVRVEIYCGGPRFWVDGKPECGTFTVDELQSSFRTLDDLRSAVWSGRIAIDVTTDHHLPLISSLRGIGGA